MRAIILTAVIIAGTQAQILQLSAPAQAATRIQGRCGITREHIVIPYKHRYRIHIGYSRAHPGHACTGIWRPLGGAARSTLLPWTPFGPQFDRWNWPVIADITITGGVTAGACMGFAGGMVGELPTAFSDTFITVAAGGGCVLGVKSLDHSLNNVFGMTK